VTRTQIWSDAAGPHDGPLVVLVHGTMDRSAGLLKLSRRLDGTHRVLRYDRRGYGRSVGAGPPYGVDAHLDDLVRLLDGRRAAVVAGHSYGGHVGLALAERRPELVAALAVYETPLSWLDWWPSTTAGSLALDGGLPAEDAAEQFMRRLVGDARWERLPTGTRAARRREGRALVGELDDLRRGAPWDAAQIAVPVVAMCGEHGAAHHRRGTVYLSEVLPDVEVVEVGGARHFGPNTHPDEVAAVVAQLVERVGQTGTSTS
jgi:pimeloyl-ACP methyl ester carboxylesterase